jgi:NADH-quinone oxidoreductase subunit G
MHDLHGAEVRVKMAENVSVTINGRTVEVPGGTLIIEAAKKAGIEIPTFCYDERLKPVGACRMCLVEVEKMPKLIASCATPVAPNMVIHTESEKVVKARKGVLEFLLINHPLDCPTCDKGGECPLQDNTYLYGPPVSRYRENKIRFRDMAGKEAFDEIPLGPEIYLCRNRCIMCYKCVRIVRELAGEADLGVFNRGALANIDVLQEVAFADEFSGNTVEFCPVGALTSRSFRYKIRDWLLKKAPSVCNLCSDGCNMNVEWSGGKVHRHMSRRNREVEDGWLCDRGRYSFDISGSEERILQPHIRRGNALEPCGWDEAFALVARHLGQIVDENRGSEVAAVGSPLLSNEEAYAVRRFFGETVMTSDIDFQIDTAQPVEPELLDLVGLEGSISDLENDSLFLFVGCDPAVEHPVASLRIRKAISKKEARAIFLGSYDKRLGYFPVTNIRIPYGAEAIVLNHVVARLKGEKTSSKLPDSVNPEAISGLAESLENQDRIHILGGKEFFHHPDRKALLASLIGFKRAASAKLSILSPSGNFMGVSRFGLYGGRDHSFNEILSRIEKGVVKTAFFFGSDPVEEYPDRKYVQEVLKKLDFLVVVSPFMGPTASMASLVFPLALLPDYGGTLVNIEGRIQLFQGMAESRRIEPRPVWALLTEISQLMERGVSWYHDSQIRQDIAANMKGMEGLTGIPETGLILSSGSEKEPGPGDVAPAPVPQAEPEYPYLLHCTRTAHHQGWLTERSSNLKRISGSQQVWINPDDAAKEGIEEGQAVRVGNSRSALNLRARLTDGVNKGEILIVNSFSDNPVNRLMDRAKSVTSVSLGKS